MSTPGPDKVFAGSVPELYQKYLVPLIFEPYVDDLVQRLGARHLTRVLEIAAGTGVVTRKMASVLPESVTIVATDLNQPMLDIAAREGTSRPVEFRQADAMALPLEDSTFDAVVCQFGVMFFPDKPKAFSEARRVLRPGGVFIFSTWDKIEENEFADIVTSSVAGLFPADPPRFLARTPYAYNDRERIARDVLDGAADRLPDIDTVPARSRASSHRDPAIGFVQGTPLRNEIEAREASRIHEATDVAADAIAERFGRGAVDAKIQAHIVTVEK